tara:strand:- start:409 stop:675 length:267 start_codon:yes stop_codon:yes gene_type:complete
VTKEEIRQKMIELFPIAMMFGYSSPKGWWGHGGDDPKGAAKAYKKAEKAQDEMSKLTGLWIMSGYTDEEMFEGDSMISLHDAYHKSLK